MSLTLTTTGIRYSQINQTDFAKYFLLNTKPATPNKFITRNAEGQITETEYDIDLLFTLRSLNETLGLDNKVGSAISKDYTEQITSEILTSHNYLPTVKAVTDYVTNVIENLKKVTISTTNDTSAGLEDSFEYSPGNNSDGTFTLGVFTGANSTTDGKRGLVPAPTKTTYNGYLSGTGSFRKFENLTITNLTIAGDSTVIDDPDATTPTYSKPVSYNNMVDYVMENGGGGGGGGIATSPIKSFNSSVYNLGVTYSDISSYTTAANVKAYKCTVTLGSPTLSSGKHYTNLIALPKLIHNSNPSNPSDTPLLYIGEIGEWFITNEFSTGDGPYSFDLYWTSTIRPNFFGKDVPADFAPDIRIGSLSFTFYFTEKNALA